MNSFKIINTDKFPEKWKTNKNLQWFLHNYPEEKLLIHPEDEFIHPFLAVEFAKQFHLEEIEILKEEIQKRDAEIEKLKDIINDSLVEYSSTHNSHESRASAMATILSEENKGK